VTAASPASSAGAAALRDLYRRRARRYDLAAALFPLAGMRLGAYRREAVAALGLTPGATVVDLACGTGLNFPWLERDVGPGGRVIGVDLTDAMLAEARRRVRAAGWMNVELVEADLADYRFPDGIDAAISTLGITLVPGYDEVITKAAAALRPGGRLAIFDLKRPGWPDPLVRFAAWVNRPFGVTLDLAVRHPWESVRRHLQQVEFREYYAGALYLSVGQQTKAATSREADAVGPAGRRGP
jgi:ubiquinone/menaquinone biosynthesis C-methylase UbiE